MPLKQSSRTMSSHELDVRSAFDLVKEPLPRDQVDVFSLRYSPATVYNALTTLMILTLQRLGGGKSLEAVVRDTVSQHTYVLPDNKRVREGTL